MFKRNELELTKGTCANVEDLRQAVEVLTGESVRIMQMKLYLKKRTGKGLLRVGTLSCEVTFSVSPGNKILFSLYFKCPLAVNYTGQWLAVFFHGESFLQSVVIYPIQDTILNQIVSGKSVTSRCGEILSVLR